MQAKTVYLVETAELGDKHNRNSETSGDGLTFIVDPELHLEGDAGLKLGLQVRLPVPVDAGGELLARGQGARAVDQGAATVHNLFGEWNGDDGLLLVGQAVVHVPVNGQVGRVVG